MTSILCKNRNIIIQVLDNLFTAISEHRWKDALTLLPTVVTFAKFRISPYFVWKVMHITMANTHIPMGIHMNILNIILKSSVKKHEAVLDMFAFNFGKIDDNDIETLSEAIREVRPGYKGQRLRDICKAYKALHYYLKWKKAVFTVLNKSWLNDAMHPEYEQSQKETRTLGKKAHNLLNQAYLAFQGSEQIDKSVEGTDSERREDTEMMCEWLLGPLLDIEHQLKITEDFTRKRSFLKQFHGLDLIEEYAKKHSNHLPALRTYYYYLTRYHLDEKTLIQDILQRIVDLSPECSLMLQYVYNILSEQIGDDADKSRSRRSNDCLLANKDIDVLLKCLRLLSNFIEYPMWRKDVRAWKTLTDILKFFHQSFVSCWSCRDCTSSKEKISKFSDTLNSWPEFLWHDFYLDSLSKGEAEVLVYAGYSSFILGYSDNISKHSLDCLKRLKCSTEATELLNLMKQEGGFMKDLLLHLAKQRKKRSLIQKKEKRSNLTKRFSVSKKNIEFGVDIESLTEVINDEEDILYDDSQSMSDIMKQDVTNDITSSSSSSKSEERMNLNSETSIQPHESLNKKEILFGKKDKNSIVGNTAQYNVSENKSMDEVPNLDLVPLKEGTSCGNIIFGKKKKKNLKNDLNLIDNSFNSRNNVSPSSSSKNADKKIRVMELGTTSNLNNTSCDESRIIKFGKRRLNTPGFSSPANLKEDIIGKDSVRPTEGASVCFGKKMKKHKDSTISLSPVKEKERSKPQIDRSTSENNFPHNTSKKVHFGKRKAVDVGQSPSRKKIKSVFTESTY